MGGGRQTHEQPAVSGPTGAGCRDSNHGRTPRLPSAAPASPTRSSQTAAESAPTSCCSCETIHPGCRQPPPVQQRRRGTRTHRRARRARLVLDSAQADDSYSAAQPQRHRSALKEPHDRNQLQARPALQLQRATRACALIASAPLAETNEVSRPHRVITSYLCRPRLGQPQEHSHRTPGYARHG